MIKSLNFQYTGPIDGHHLSGLIRELQHLKKQKGARFLHVITTKGKGLKQAEENQVVYHAPGRFDKITGELVHNTEHKKIKYQDVFGLTLLELARKNPKIVAITPAMPTGSSLKYMMDEFPDRAIDVGIAEQHAVTLAAGIALSGCTVFCTVYSTFLQRAYDQVIHDVALQNVPVILCIDRAGLVGEDGATHQGVFDIAYLNAIPNMTILAPKDAVELRQTLYSLQNHCESPVAVRYPRGFSNTEHWQIPFEKLDFNKIQEIKKGTKIAVFSTGTILENVMNALEFDQGNIAVFHFLQIKPLDKHQILSIAQEFQTIVTIEEGVITGGFGSSITQLLSKNGWNKKIINLGVPDAFIEHATVHEQMEECGLDAISLQNLFKNLSNV